MRRGCCRHALGSAVRGGRSPTGCSRSTSGRLSRSSRVLRSLVERRAVRAGTSSGHGSVSRSSMRRVGAGSCVGSVRSASCRPRPVDELNERGRGALRHDRVPESVERLPAAGERTGHPSFGVSHEPLGEGCGELVVDLRVRGCSTQDTLPSFDRWGVGSELVESSVSSAISFEIELSDGPPCWFLPSDPVAVVGVGSRRTMSDSSS